MKKFLVQIQPGQATRFNISDDLLADLIATVVTRSIEFYTAGPVPAVTVTQEEKPEPALPVCRYCHRPTLTQPGPNVVCGECLKTFRARPSGSCGCGGLCDIGHPCPMPTP